MLAPSHKRSIAPQNPTEVQLRRRLLALLGEGRDCSPNLRTLLVVIVQRGGQYQAWYRTNSTHRWSARPLGTTREIARINVDILALDIHRSVQELMEI